MRTKSPDPTRSHRFGQRKSHCPPGALANLVRLLAEAAIEEYVAKFEAEEREEVEGEECERELAE